MHLGVRVLVVLLRFSINKAQHSSSRSIDSTVPHNQCFAQAAPTIDTSNITEITLYYSIIYTGVHRRDTTILYSYSITVFIVSPDRERTTFSRYKRSRCVIKICICCSVSSTCLPRSRWVYVRIMSWESDLTTTADAPTLFYVTRQQSQAIRVPDPT